MKKFELVSTKYWEMKSSLSQRQKTIGASKLQFFFKDCVLFSSLQFEIFMKILPKYLHKNDEVLEIGSGPGRNLAIINKLIGCKVFGIEKSKTRFIENVKLFTLNDIPRENVTLGDALKIKDAKKFDSVLSFGFIEHYYDPLPIVEAQLKFLKKGGWFICFIPNFSGINRIIQRKIDKRVLDSHNLVITDRKKYEELFVGLEKHYCGYCGILSDRIFSKMDHSKIPVLSILKPFRLLSNIFLIALTSVLPTSRISSGPYLVYIGKKK